MTYSETDVRLELEAALATHHPHEDWIRSVAGQFVCSSRTVMDLVGLIDGCERVVFLQYIRSELRALLIDPETMSKRTARDAIDFGEHTREDVPAFVREHRERFVWIHPDWRRPPYPRTDEIGTRAGQRARE